MKPDREIIAYRVVVALLLTIALSFVGFLAYLHYCVGGPTTVYETPAYKIVRTPDEQPEPPVLKTKPIQGEDGKIDAMEGWDKPMGDKRQFRVRP